ncbi:unnamed protein product [Effrenium voratum]|nr:unnamed protein product [Effrenium voratum]
MEMRPKKIACHYLKTWFIADFLIVMVDVGLKVTEIMAANSNDSLSYVRLLRVLRFLRFIRLLRLSKIATAVEIMYRRIKSPLLWLLMKIMNGLMLILAVNHYLAIAFLAIGLQNQASDVPNWIKIYELQNGNLDDFWDQYLTALHWSLTQFMPATNNVGPVTGPERVFAIFVVIVALAIFSSFVSSITTAVTALRAVKESNARAEAQVRQFFTERDLSADLLTHVRQCWAKKATQSYRLVESDLVMFQDDLPEKTRMRLHKERCSSKPCTTSTGCPTT